jgi:hypothetical protein
VVCNDGDYIMRTAIPVLANNQWFTNKK